MKLVLYIKNKLVLLLLIFLLIACSQRRSDEKNFPDKKTIEETMISTNIIMLELEDQEMDDFIDRYGWNVKKTGSGLRYEIYHKGKGEPTGENKIAHINYEIRLLTGDLVYSSEEEGVKSFRIGRGGVESGLEEGILLMRVGDKARFIMPPHLAHGVPGDGVKIPKRVPIVYNVELLNITNL